MLKRYPIATPLLGVIFVLLCIFINIALETSIGSRVYGLMKDGSEFSRLFDKALSMSGDSISRQVVSLVADDPVKHGLPVYRLKLSPADVSQFSKYTSESMKRGEKVDELNLWRKASLEYEGEKYKIKVKMHGTAVDHYRSRKKSFSIKSKKKINGITRFALLNGPSLETVLSYKMLDMLGIFHAKAELVVLYINNENFGLYLLEEKLNKELLEKNNLATSLVLKTRPDFKNFQSEGHQTNYDLTTFNVETETVSADLGETDFSSQKSKLFPNIPEIRASVAVSALGKFFEALKSGDNAEILRHIDLDSFARSEAFRFITGHVHYVVGDNRRFVYEYSTGKFLFFYPRPEGGFTEIYKAPGNPGRFESQFYEYKYLRGTQIARVAAKLATIPEFRERRNLYLRQYLEKKEELLKLYADLSDEYRLMIYADDSVYYDGDLARNIEAFRRGRVYFANNLNLLSEYLEYGRGFLNIALHNDHMDVVVALDSNTPVEVSKLNISMIDPDESSKIKTRLNLYEKFVGSAVMNGIDDNQIQVLGEKRIRVDGDFQNILISDVVFSLRNIWGKFDLPEDKVRVVVRDLRSYGSVINGRDAIDYLIKTGAVLEGDVLTLRKGNYHIQQTLDLQNLAGLSMEAGAVLQLDKSVSVVGLSFLTAKGTVEKPVVVKASTEESFGSLGVNGDGTKECHIDHMIFQNGSESVVNGLYSSAAFYISKCDTYLSNSSVKDNTSEDGLNVKNAKVAISDSVFSNNFADQVDLDTTTGSVRNSFFSVPGVANGDGLDMSGSTLIVEGNKFEGFKDKGVSVGEHSYALIVRNQLIDNNNGIAVKDSSTVFLYHNDYLNNTFDVSSYIKKAFFFDPKIYFFHGAGKGNEKLNIIDGEVRVHRLPKTILEEFNQGAIPYESFEWLLNLKEDVNNY